MDYVVWVWVPANIVKVYIVVPICQKSQIETLRDYSTKVISDRRSVFIKKVSQISRFSQLKNISTCRWSCALGK